MAKIKLGINVLEAAKQRISSVFDEFDKICVSFSGGKDSSVMTHLVMDEAKKRGRKVALLFVDWECQFQMTIDHLESVYSEYSDNIIPYWLTLQIKTDNSCSMYEPEFISWEESKKHLWVRDKPKFAISSHPAHYNGMTFEEFIPEFSKWFCQGEKAAFFVGIRTQESLNRFRAIARDKDNYNNCKWSTRIIDEAWNFYPIYDWTTNDIWTYFAKTGKSYTKLYDRMYQAGVPFGKMRIDEPFGDTQRSALWLFQVVEPEMWAKMVARIAGVNTAGLYGREKGSVMGHHTHALPAGYTWKTFCEHLIKTLPPKTASHYKNKIAVYFQWYKKKGYIDSIPDEIDPELEKRGLAPSWKLICKCILRNDYWCRWMGFSPTKTAAYQKYEELCRKRRKEWGIFADD